MGGSSSKPAAMPADSVIDTNIPDAALSSNITTEAENAAKHRQYAKLKSSVANSNTNMNKTATGSRPSEPSMNVIEAVYNEDFDTIDQIQAMRFPPYVAKQIKEAVRNECERKCAEQEKKMARCLQDKMWTSWKCQKERDTYYCCVEDEEKRNTNPSRPFGEVEVDTTTTTTTMNNSSNNGKHSSTTAAAAATALPSSSSTKAAAGAVAPAEPDNFVDLLTAYRWKFNLGVLHGEIIGRNNIMRAIWRDHFPDRDLAHPWVKDEE